MEPMPALFFSVFFFLGGGRGGQTIIYIMGWFPNAFTAKTSWYCFNFCLISSAFPGRKVVYLQVSLAHQ